jgi:hypothetical protein
MADNTIAFSVKIDGMDREIKSLSDLKKAKQDATAAFLKGDKDAAKALADLKDKTEDLADATQTLKGSGVEKLNSSFSQLADGFKNFDTDKIKTGFKGIASAMSAIPILLIVEGIKYLIQNFEELSQGSGVLAKILTVVGQALNGVKESLYAVTDAIGATNHQLDLMGDLINENIIKFKELTDQTVHNYDRQIAVARAAGQETIDIEIAKQKQIIFTNSIIVKQIEAYVRAGGQLNDEKKKQLTAALEANKDALAQIKVIEIGHTKDLNKENEQRLADHKKLLADKQKAEDEAWALTLQIRASNREAQDADDKRLAEEAKAQKDLDNEAFMADVSANSEFVSANAVSDKQVKDELRAQELEDFKTNYSAQLQIAQTTSQSLQSLSDLYFIVKSKNLQKGTAAELKAAEQQFKINKALAITSAVISGIQGVINALSAQSVIPEPFGTILKVASAVGIGIAAAANVAKIASTKFNPGGGAPSGGGATTAVPIPAPPTINTPNANTNSSTTFDASGQRTGGSENERTMNPTITVKATVVETEMTETQKRVSALETQSKF